MKGMVGMSTGLYLRIGLFTAVVIGFWFLAFKHSVTDNRADASAALRQLDPAYDSGDVREGLLASHGERNSLHFVGLLCIAAIGAVIFSGDMAKAWKKMAVALFCLSLTGCWRPFEPVKLEVIQT